MVSPCEVLGKLSYSLSCEMRAVDTFGYDLTFGIAMGLLLFVAMLFLPDEGSK